MAKKISFDLILVFGVFMFLGIMVSDSSLSNASIEKEQGFVGVCPPFYIRDDRGTAINPVKNQNTDVPYSPKQTCGLAGCHNYEKITKGYHFQQGKDEEANQESTILYQWVLSPGQYGGRW